MKCYNIEKIFFTTIEKPFILLLQATIWYKFALAEKSIIKLWQLKPNRFDAANQIIYTASLVLRSFFWSLG